MRASGTTPRQLPPGKRVGTACGESSNRAASSTPRASSCLRVHERRGHEGRESRSPTASTCGPVREGEFPRDVREGRAQEKHPGKCKDPGKATARSWSSARSDDLQEVPLPRRPRDARLRGTRTVNAGLTLSLNGTKVVLGRGLPRTSQFWTRRSSRRLFQPFHFRSKTSSFVFTHTKPLLGEYLLPVRQRPAHTTHAPSRFNGGPGTKALNEYCEEEVGRARRDRREDSGRPSRSAAGADLRGPGEVHAARVGRIRAERGGPDQEADEALFHKNASGADKLVGEGRGEPQAPSQLNTIKKHALRAQSGRERALCRSSRTASAT